MTDLCAPHLWAKAHNRPSKGGKIKSILLLFNLCNFYAPRDTPNLPTKETCKHSVIYPRQTNVYSNEQYKKPTHHDVFLNTEKRDSYHPYASPEGVGRTPPRGDKWRMQNGTLSAAMRLKALSQAPPEITRHPMTTKQPKRYQNPKISNPEPPNHPPIRNSGLAPSTTCNIREKQGGVRRA
jgi:hypothetical protein